jgi:hypothetical protein
VNAGLSNLRTLKQHLLPDSWQTETQLDDQLVLLGLGVANQLEEYCGRKFQRIVGDTFETGAAVALIQLPRFPLEVQPTIAIRYAAAADYSDDVSDWIDQSWASGVVQLVGEPGTHRDRLRLTYTGGYWWDTSEDASEEAPEGSFDLPMSLQLAWLQQCKHTFAASEMMTRRALASDSEQADKAKASYAYELLPAVVAALKPFCLLAG